MSKDFENELAALSKRIEQSKEHVSTEEATKMSFIVPFFQILGYDTYNPSEFVPEYTADINNKNMDKVDYTIMENGQPIILIEAKHWRENLSNHTDQLFKYFVSTPAKFAILTNGIEYLFYTDMEELNKLDKKPFLKVNMLDIRESTLKELKKFNKDRFDVNEILTTAEELKYTNSIISLLANEYHEPTDEFVKYVLGSVYEGIKTQAVIEKYKPIVKNSFSQFVNELINDKIKTAFKSEQNDIDDEIVATTEIEDIDISANATTEELECFYIIKSILSEIAPVDNIFYKNTESYFGILFENNTRKWICRFKLSDSRKVIIFPQDVNPLKVNIETTSEVYAHKSIILRSCQRFLS